MKTKSATKDESARMEKIKMIGCLICGDAPCQAHHLLRGGVRRGHKFTIGLCIHHHETRNDPTGNDPSYHGAKRNFNRLYGTDDELLTKQNEILGYFP